MNKLMTAIFASAFLCLSSFSPVWADGWGNTNWGMNIPQVEMAAKSKVILNEGPEFDPKTISHKLQDNVSIGEHTFNVVLNFTDRKLDKIILQNKADNAYAAYLYLLDELKKKYGPPTTEPESKKLPSMLTNRTQWITKETIIDLSNTIIFLEKTHYYKSLRYSARKSAASGNL